MYCEDCSGLLRYYYIDEQGKRICPACLDDRIEEALNQFHEAQDELSKLESIRNADGIYQVEGVNRW